MREAIGGTWLFQIVILFILLFTGFMCLSINHSKAFKVQSSIIDIIERHNGVDLTKSPSSDETLKDIVDLLKKTSYRTTGKCPTEKLVNNTRISYQGFTRDGNQSGGSDIAFCIAKVETTSFYSVPIPQELPNMPYYRVVVFYQLDLPIFNDLFNFRLTGDTKVLSVSKTNR